MKHLKKLTKRADFYGKGVTLNINGKETIKSFMGGFFTISYLLLFSVIFILNLIDFSARNPIIVINSYFRDLTEAYDTMTENEISFATYFTNFKALPPSPMTFYPNNISSVSMSLEYVNNTEIMSPIKPVNFTKCEENPLYMNDPHFQSPYNIAKMKSKGRNFASCFTLNSEGSIIMGGDTETRNKTYINLLKVRYDLCELVDKSRGCVLSDEEFETISSVDFIMLLRNSYADYQSDSGISEFYEGMKLKLDYESDYLFKFSSKRLRVITDRNLIYNLFPNEESQNYIHSLTVSSEKKERERNIFEVSFEFGLSNYVDEIERRYLKVDEMLANVGSIVVIIEFFARLLAEFFSEANMEHSIYKEVYHIQKPTNKTEFLSVDFNRFKLNKKNKAFGKSKNDLKEDNKNNKAVDNLIDKENNNNNQKNDEIDKGNKIKKKSILTNLKNRTKISKNITFSDITDIESKKIENKDNNNIFGSSDNVCDMLKALNNDATNENNNHNKNQENEKIIINDYNTNISFISNVNNEKSDISHKPINKERDKNFKFSGFMHKESIELHGIPRIPEPNATEFFPDNKIVSNNRLEGLLDKNTKNSVADKENINNIFKGFVVNKIIQNVNRNDKKIYDEFRKLLKEKTIKKSIKVRLYQIFMPCLIKKNKKMRLLINLQEFISEELDMVKIIKKLIEYEHFKGLILTENQIKIFNIMQKRIVTEEILKKDSSDYYKDFYFSNKMKDLKKFKYLVDNLFEFDEENKYSKILIEKLKSSFSL